jgi:hypothetical protein
MRPQVRLLALLCLSSLAASCGDDGTQTPVPGEDVGTGVDATDVDPTAPDADAAVPVPDTTEDGSDSGPDVEVPDTEPTGPCAASLECVNERTGNASVAVCLQAGFPQGTLCIPEDETFCCLAPFACETSQDCEDARAIEGFCADDRFPCVCLEGGVCDLGICSDSSECAEGERCLAGRCQTPPAPGPLTGRSLVTLEYVRPGTSWQVPGYATERDDVRRTYPETAVEYVLESGGEAGSVSPGGLFTASESAGVARIRVRVDASDPGTVVFITNVGPEEATPRLWVIDEATRLPIEGAVVLVDRSTPAPAPEEPAEGEGVESLRTDSTGLAALEDLEDAQWVTVVAPGYAVVTIPAQAIATVLLALPPTQFADIQEERGRFVCDTSREGVTLDDSGECGGVAEPPCLCYDLEGVDVVRGLPGFSQVRGSGEVDVALTGFALGNNLLDLNFDLIVGPEINRLPPPDSPIPLSGELGIPSGVSLFFNGSPFVDSFIGTGAAGDRILWSVGGRVFLSDVLNQILPALGGSLDFGPIIAGVLPLFDSFYSGISAPVTMQAGGTFPVRSPSLDLEVPTLRRIRIEPPALPRLGTGWSDTGIVLGGALLPGQGLLPTGITGATDTVGSRPANGRLDGDTSTPENDPLRISLAPLHGALDTPWTQYLFASVALQLGSSTGGPRDATSGLLTLVPRGGALPPSLDLQGEAFPAFLEGAGFDGETRVLTMGTREEPVDMFRIVVQRNRQAWVIYAPGDQSSLTLPDPAAWQGMEEGPISELLTRGRINVLALDFRTSDAIDFADVLQPDGRNLPDLYRYISGFSLIGL